MNTPESEFDDWYELTHSEDDSADVDFPEYDDMDDTDIED